MKPVCVPCQRFFRCTKNDYYFIEAMPRDNDTLPGTVDASSWTPYKIWAADKWTCEGCGTEILSGFARHPIAEHYQPQFKSEVERLYADQLQVNDC